MQKTVSHHGRCAVLAPRPKYVGQVTCFKYTDGVPGLRLERDPSYVATGCDAELLDPSPAVHILDKRCLDTIVHVMLLGFPRILHYLLEPRSFASSRVAQEFKEFRVYWPVLEFLSKRRNLERLQISSSSVYPSGRERTEVEELCDSILEDNYSHP